MPSAEEMEAENLVNTSAGRRRPKIGSLSHGDLTQLGYSATAPRRTRRRAIKKAVRKFGALSTFRKLNAVAVYSKRTPKGRIFKADRNWERKTFLKR
jgi:hypothetical protein